MGLDRRTRAGGRPVAGSPDVTAQVTSSAMRGQNIAPVYEGWEKNPDGSFNLLFGYFNRNLGERIDIPVGPDNTIEPGGPDQGQPTHFYPRRSRFLFKIRVPADFGDKELVWTLTSNGQTEKAYASLLVDYFIDDTVVQNNKGAGGGAGGQYVLTGNVPPDLRIEGPRQREAAVGEPLELAAVVTDDGIPRPRTLMQDRAGHARQQLRAVAGLVRLPRAGRGGCVRPAAAVRLGGHAAGGRGRQLQLVARLEGAAGAARRPLGIDGDVRRARDVRAARLGRRRRPDGI